MQKNYTQLFIGLFLGLIFGLLISKFIFLKEQKQTNNTATVNKNIDNNNPSISNNVQNINPNSGNYNANVVIPKKVYDVLKYIKEKNRAMDGYVGGRVFTNRERIVPTQDDKGNNIQYQEWDVNPKIDGQNRGTERILTGSDNRSWYTNDHYKSFTQIK